MLDVATGGDNVVFVEDTVVLDVALLLPNAWFDALLEAALLVTEVIGRTTNLVAIPLKDASVFAEAVSETLPDPFGNEAGIATGQNVNWPFASSQ